MPGAPRAAAQVEGGNLDAGGQVFGEPKQRPAGDSTGRVSEGMNFASAAAGREPTLVRFPTEASLVVSAEETGTSEVTSKAARRNISKSLS